MELILFEILNNIKLSCSIFSFRHFPIWFYKSHNKHPTWICPEFRWKPENIIWKLVTNNNYDDKSCDANQWNISCSALLTLCSSEILDCKLQCAELNSQVNKNFTYHNQLKHNHTKRVIIDSLFNFLLGTPNSAEEFIAIKTICKY